MSSHASQALIRHHRGHASPTCLCVTPLWFPKQHLSPSVANPIIWKMASDLLTCVSLTPKLQLQDSVHMELPLPPFPSSFSFYSFDMSMHDICHSCADCPFPHMDPSVLGDLTPSVVCMSYTKAYHLGTRRGGANASCVSSAFIFLMSSS